MDATRFLQDMLSEGRALWERGAEAADKGAAYAADQLGAPEGAENHDLYKTIAKGAAGVGALALAFGTKGGGALARLGGLAAIGAMAYGAYRKQSGADAPEDGGRIDAADGDEADRRAKTLLRTMIMAARADGQVDAEERALITDKLSALGDEAERFFLDEMMKPVDAAALAAEAQSAQEAREIYTMARVASRGDTPSERAFLDALISALGLAPGVVSEIDGAVAAG